MPKKKLERFAELDTFPNSYFLSHEVAIRDDFPMKGKWNADHFRNDAPITLELGCGKGEYTVGLAKKYPLKNIIGVDIKGNRIWVAAKPALSEKIVNAAFLRMRIDHITSAFALEEVSEIWITFPDPHPTSKGLKRRLTSAVFLERYRKITKAGSFLHLKTDDFGLYEFTLETVLNSGGTIIDRTKDLYTTAQANDQWELVKGIQTYYERKFLEQGSKICYVKFTL